MDKAENFFNMSWELSKKFYQNHPLRSEKRVIRERKGFEAEFCHNKGAVLADADQYKKAKAGVLNLFFNGATSTQWNIFGGRNQHFKLKWCTVSPVIFF